MFFIAHRARGTLHDKDGACKVGLDTENKRNVPFSVSLNLQRKSPRRQSYREREALCSESKNYET